jgi:hypothetical protein
MNKTGLFCLIIAAVFAPVLSAQRWEFGGGAGGGLYTSQDVKGASTSGSAKIATGLAASAWLDNNNGRLWGGELRYDYQMGDLRISSGSTSASFAARSQGIHYDFLLHTASRNARIRPFIAFGGGVKFYQGVGTEVVAQPLNSLALLTRTSETCALASVGAGVKFNTGRLGFRIEIHDYMTPFPTQVIAAAQNASIGGWTHDLVVDFGLSLLSRAE